MKKKYSFFNIIKNSLSHNENWEKMWRSPEPRKFYDIIIVGGGPAGCASACHAANKGYKVLLLEKNTYPRDKVCGDAVGGKALKHLEELDLLDTLKESPHFIFDSVLFSNTKSEKVCINIKGWNS